MLEEIMLIFLLLLVITVWVVGWIRDEKKYKVFDKVYPVGSLFFTKVKKQEFPWGKWVYRGTDQDGFHVYVRVK